MSNVYYAFDSYALSENSRATIRKNAEWLRDRPDVNVMINGHADERGTLDYNRALAKKRAMSAAEYLETLGIEARRISTNSYGEEQPLDPGHNEEAWAKNRRVEFEAMGEGSE